MMDRGHAAAGRPPANRGRPRGFDRQIALTRLRAAFARRGYAGTSVEALSKATGLHRPSLDRAFGDKRRMLLASLEDEHRALQTRLDGLASSERGVQQRIEQYFEAVVADYCAARPDPPGLALAAGLADVVSDRRVSVWLRRIQLILTEAAERALGPAPKAYCDLLADLAFGLCVRSRLAQGGIGCDGELAVRAELIAAMISTTIGSA
jgi:AcrR family transcriptional regulator